MKAGGWGRRCSMEHVLEGGGQRDGKGQRGGRFPYLVGLPLTEL